jgi:hypothetical protein
MILIMDAFFIFNYTQVDHIYHALYLSGSWLDVS